MTKAALSYRPVANLVSVTLWSLLEVLIQRKQFVRPLAANLQASLQRPTPLLHYYPHFLSEAETLSILVAPQTLHLLRIGVPAQPLHYYELVAPTQLVNPPQMKLQRCNLYPSGPGVIPPLPAGVLHATLLDRPLNETGLAIPIQRLLTQERA